LKINYNNSQNPYLQGYPGSAAPPPQERQAGWTESYTLLPLAQTPLGSLPMQNAYTLVQARAALLGLNFYIKTAICHQASVFKSSWPMPGSAKYPLWDSLSTGTTVSNQLCSSPEENLLLRLEANSLYRWEHGIRGIKEYVSADTMSYFAATSYADSATFATTSMFDSLQQAIPIPGATVGTPAQITVVNTNGTISGASLASGGNYPGDGPGGKVTNGSYYCYFYSASGQSVVAWGSCVMIGGVVSNPVILSGGAGYTGTTVYVPLSNDCNAAGTTLYGLPNYLLPSTYWANFLSCLISFTESGTTRRISQSTYTAPIPTFPSGLVPAIMGTPAKCNRSMVQRVGNRQTGQIRLTKPARVKRAK